MGPSTGQTSPDSSDAAADVVLGGEELAPDLGRGGKLGHVGAESLDGQPAVVSGLAQRLERRPQRQVAGARRAAVVLRDMDMTDRRPHGGDGADRVPGEDRVEIDLAVPGRAEAAGALGPWRVAGVDALATGGVELGVLDVEHPDPVAVDVDVGEIIEALQHVVRRVVEHVRAGVALHPVEEHLEGGPVEQVLAGMDLVADVDAGLLGLVEQRPPAAGELGEGGLDQTSGSLRPGIGVGPGQRAREARERVEPEAA